MYVKSNLLYVKIYRVYSDIKNSLPIVEETEVPTPVKVAPAPAPAPYVAPAPAVEEPAVEDNDDIAVVGEEEEAVPNVAVPYGITPVHYYAPQQGYYQPPVTPAVVQAPVQAPVAYYAPYHGYQPATVPVTYQAAPAAVTVPQAVPTHSQFHAQVKQNIFLYQYLDTFLKVAKEKK